MEAADASLATTDRNENNQPSFWARKFNITSFKSDPWRWNKEWEKVLRTLSFKDAYTVMCQVYKDVDPSKLPQLSQGLKDVVCDVQNILVKEWDEMVESRQFVTAWLLLEERERKRHLMKGMEEACQHASLHQDLRALCPEITITSMLKQNGRAFIEFVDVYVMGKKNVIDGNPYFLPSEWWNMAESLSEEFILLTVQRNEFISRFIMHTYLSVVHDFVYGSAGMDPVTDFVNSDQIFARAWSKTVSGRRDKPLIRCENCTKSPEEIGRNVKFMLCSTCKSKLDFVIHYCSQECQKEDWRRHKKHCGKSRVSKKLRGTVHDPHWASPEMPDHARQIRYAEDGSVDFGSVGFGVPEHASTYSPALQRQVSLLTADNVTDYFLFDFEDCPVRFVLFDQWMKMAFRALRGDVLSGEVGLEAMAEYLIKAMGPRPGLGRDRILAQLEREYGGDVATKVAAWEELTVRNGYSGSTYLEVTSRNLRLTASKTIGSL